MSADLQTLCDAVDGDALMRHVGAFAQWEKLSGTAGEADSMPVATVSSETAGFFRAIDFAESIAFRAKPPRLASCS